MSSQTKYLLPESELPRAWYNLRADLPFDLPPVLHPGTKQPVGPDDLAPLFPMAIIQQEVTKERWVEIPQEVREVYKLWRPAPLFRAHRLERALQTPAKIFYKYEGVSPSGSHKPNTAVPQAFYNQQEGTKRITTETGAGQWGSSLAFACQIFGIDLKVYMVKVSYGQKPYRRFLMQTYGAQVVASPSMDTNTGRTILAKDPDCSGSLGIAISEAVEDAVTSKVPTKYALGSVLEHVLMHQSIIGLEAKKQLEMAEVQADVVIGCIGGGSNFAGFAYPFLQDKITGVNPKLRVVAIEPTATPSLTRGVYGYDFGDTARLTPLMKMYTLGHGFMPAPIHAGGLRYHGMASSICELYRHKLIEARAVNQLATFESGVLFARCEGILPAPESTHAIRGAVEEALRCRENGSSETIVFNLSGHGHFDLTSYERYLGGQLVDYELPQTEIDRATAELPKV
ncbi:MAG: TrpB-like pyridoxal phosphate-dependent enzyme [Kiritimatiellia bacterium]